MRAYESTPINHIMWTTFRLDCVNGWSIAHDSANKQYLAVQSDVLVIFKYEEENKLDTLQEAKCFAERNTLTSLADSETETHFFASEDLFFYRRLYCSACIAFGDIAKPAVQKVLQQDMPWLRELARAIGEQPSSLQLNENVEFLKAVHQIGSAC